MKVFYEFILYIVYRNLGHDFFTVIILREWLKSTLKEGGYIISDVNLTYDIKVETTTNLPLTYEIIRNQSFSGTHTNLLTNWTTRQDDNDVYYTTNASSGNVNFNFTNPLFIYCKRSWISCSVGYSPAILAFKHSLYIFFTIFY